MQNAFSEFLSPEERTALKRVIKDPVLRMHAVQTSFALFQSVYFGDKFEYPFAPLHKEFMALAEDQQRKFYVIRASRGFAKTTILNTHYAIWAVLGRQQKKLVVLVAQTMERAEQYMANIKYELEHNELLRRDLGPFHEDGTWSTPSIVIDNYNARIFIASVNSPIRGALHGGNRIDLCLIDDIENLESVRTRESRDKIYNWFVSEVVPAGSVEKTKTMMLGTHLHDDSLLSRVAKEIHERKRMGFVRSYPFLDEKGESLWKARYPSPEAVQNFREWIGNEQAFERECMLRTPLESGQIVQPGWVREYEAHQHPGFEPWTLFRSTVISVDAAGTNAEKSDYHAIVVGDVWRYGAHTRIYIVEAYEFHSSLEDLQQRIADLYETHRTRTRATPKILTEKGGMQGWLAEGLKSKGLYNLEERSAKGVIKGDRLLVASGPMQRGQVWLQKGGVGVARLLEEILGFGNERYDDLVDAFTQLILYIEENKNPALMFPQCDIASSILFPVERELAAGMQRTNVAPEIPKDIHRKTYHELTEEERKQLEKEEDLRLGKESEKLRSQGLYWL